MTRFRSQATPSSWAARHRVLSAALSVTAVFALSGLAANAHSRAPARPSTAGQAGLAASDAAGTVSSVVDGDTLDVEGVGRVRVIGIDTPERGSCGYDESAELLRQLVLGRSVVLTPATDKDDADAYGRLLRYVDVDGVDAGLAQIRAGHAVARYDSRDGYGAHPREDVYVATDARTQAYDCSLQPSPAPASPRPASAPDDPGGQPWEVAGPDLDCADVREAVRISGPDYHRLDADGDGWGCESYG
jgi:endonuclease YncB( thermonuclease family)